MFLPVYLDWLHTQVKYWLLGHYRYTLPAVHITNQLRVITIQIHLTCKAVSALLSTMLRSAPEAASASRQLVWLYMTALCTVA